MQILSGGDKTCDSSVAYCWYSCTDELQLASGLLGLLTGTLECVCDPLFSDPPSDNLNAATCYDPAGTADCTWYGECLNKRKPCEQTSDAYAISYGEYYCKKFANYSSMFTATVGQGWIAAVRKCLQVKLVPLIRATRPEQDCKTIHNAAIAAHDDCYLKPNGTGSTSICDLPCPDLGLILFTIYPELLHWDTWTTGYQVVKGCIKKTIRCWENLKCFRAVKLEIQNKTPISKPPPASNLTTAIRDALKWGQQGIKVLGSFGVKVPSYVGETLDLMMAVPDFLDCLNQLLPTRKRAASSVNMDEVVAGLENEVKAGSLHLDVGGSQVYVAAMTNCTGIDCDTPTGDTVTAPPLDDVTTGAVIPGGENTPAPGNPPDGASTPAAGGGSGGSGGSGSSGSSDSGSSRPGTRRRRRKGYAQKGRGKQGKGRQGLGGNGSAGKGKGSAGKGNGQAGKGNGSAGKGQAGNGKGNVGKGSVGKGKGQAGKGKTGKGKGNTGKGAVGKGTVGKGKGQSGKGH